MAFYSHIFNELPIPERRYLEHVIIAEIVPTAKKPNNHVFQRCSLYNAEYDCPKYFALGIHILIDTFSIVFAFVLIRCMISNLFLFTFRSDISWTTKFLR